MAAEVFVAAAQWTTRSALRLLLEQEGFDVVGEASDAHELLLTAASAYPRVLLLDWGLPGLSGDELLCSLRSLLPDLTVIALSGRPEVRKVALSAGANSFVSKGDSPERLLAALREASEATGGSLPRSGWRGRELAAQPRLHDAVGKGVRP